MGLWQSPLIRIATLIAAVAMLIYLPTREFLKVTFMLGAPFILVLGYTGRQRRHSVTWFVSLLLLVVIGGGYLYMLANLPERIEVRRIVQEGSNLVNEGQYGEAIARYEELGRLGRTEEMHERVAWASRESDGAALLQQAQNQYNQGNKAQALELLSSIPPDTRAAAEGAKLKKQWGS